MNNPTRIPVLDKGWIELLDMMPHPQSGVSLDLAVVNAARTSFLGESKGEEADKKLLFYTFMGADDDMRNEGDYE